MPDTNDRPVLDVERPAVLAEEDLDIFAAGGANEIMKVLIARTL